jgi:hypothetical protein
MVPLHVYQIYGTITLRTKWYLFALLQTKELVESGTIKTAPLRVQSVLDGLCRAFGNK